MCLGVKARHTNRASNAKDLIRTGCPGPAVLRVTVTNKGVWCSTPPPPPSLRCGDAIV